MLHDSSSGELSAKVLLVEDNPSDVYLVRLALQAIPLPCELAHFDDSEKALTILTSSEDGKLPDLIILDLNMPRKSGFEVLADLRKLPRLSETPVLILTSSVSPEDKRLAALSGVSRYVSKPVELDEFLRVIGTSVQETVLGARRRL